MRGRAGQALRVNRWARRPRLNLQPCWNAAPRQKLLIVRSHGAGDGAGALPMDWGFVQCWEKDPKGCWRVGNVRNDTPDVADPLPPLLC